MTHKSISALPVADIEYAVRRLPPADIVTGDFFEFLMPPPPVTVRNKGDHENMEPMKVITFKKNGRSWALESWRGY